jgi:hypothetical protein
MQRLFSMFPAGTAGIALVLMRLCVMIMLVALSSGQSTNPTLLLIISVAVLLLAVGAFTPIACLTCLITNAFLLQGIHGVCLAIGSVSIPSTLALFLLGPGAYSVDAKRFGRRLITPRH